MRKGLRRKPSAPMVVAIVALVVAASGTAVAASHLVKGDKLIAKRSLSGNRLKNHTITGTQIDLGKLGQVPSAASATSAQTAINAQELGGQAPSAFLPASSRIGTAGIVKSSGSSTGTGTTLFTVGPFTVTMTCTKTGSNVALALSAASTEAGSILNGTLVPTAGQAVDLGTNTDIQASNNFREDDDVNIDFEAPSGAQGDLVGADGINSLGADCWANWVGLH